MKTKVLAIDDSRTIRNLLAATLEEAGFEYHCAVDGREGVDMYDDVAPDVVITDINMPNLDGFGVIEELRGDGINSKRLHKMSGSIQDTFFEECEELLEAMDEGLTAIEGGDHDPEVVNAVFRAVHSIKGGAGAFGLDELVAFAHKFETVFDEVRSNKLELDTKLIQLLLRCSDHLADLVTVSRDGGSVDEEHNDVLIAGLEEYLDEEEEDLTFEPMGLGGPSVPLPLAVEEEKSYEIRFRPLKEMFGTGNEPFFLFQALSELGTLEVVLDETELPGFDAMAMDDSYLAWNLTLTTTEPKSAVEAVFEFVEGLCELSIASDKDAEEEAAALAALNAAFGVPGDMIPIYDLSARFGLQQTEASERNVVIVVAVHGKPVGLLAESVSEIISINPEEIQDTPPVDSRYTMEYIQGIISHDDTMVRIINLDAVISAPEQGLS
eukprot:g19685.t1